VVHRYDLVVDAPHSRLDDDIWRLWPDGVDPSGHRPLDCWSDPYWFFLLSVINYRVVGPIYRIVVTVIYWLDPTLGSQWRSVRPE